MTFRPCAIVPSRNHWRALPAVVARLVAAGLPVMVVDDGSDQPAAAAIAAQADTAAGVTVLRRPANGGKGAAVTDGFRHAIAAGFTHAVQVDADGQHDLDALPTLLDQARAHPQALVSGAPVYDSSVPTGRRVGRWLTHVWVFVETLSLRITDSMCGFRVYPLAAVEHLLAEEQVGQHMDFDTDIMVRLFWRGVPPVMLPVRVTYPPDNTSNFDVLRDNWRITRMHTRLVLTMLARLPRILAHRPPLSDGAPSHWADLAERGAYWGLAFVAAAYRLLGRAGCTAVMAPIVLYFLLTGGRQRRASQAFLARAMGRRAGWWESYRHMLGFAGRALDAFAAWTGAIHRWRMVIDDQAALAAAAADRRGALLVVAHAGNVELARALMSPDLRRRLTVLVHTRHAANYNRLLREFNPEAGARLVQVTEIGPDTAIALRQRIEAGEWVAIAGDRVPVLSRGHTARAPFLGAYASFATGPWLLAALLDCPVHLLFCRRDGKCWRLRLAPFAERVDLPRGARKEALAAQVARYAAALEEEVRRDPFQWYNFFDFWAAEDAEA